jgi:pilus assembly protein CpaD
MTISYRMNRRVVRSSILLVTGLAAMGLAGCESLDQKPQIHAGWSILDQNQRHPIMVSQEPHKTSIRVSRNASGLTPSQREQISDFFAKYRAHDAGNSKIVISVPAGSVNEVAAMHAVGDMRPILTENGFLESSVSIEPYYSSGDPQPPVRISYLRYVAEGPECGRFPDNLGESTRGLNYHNFGCAQQKNLAAQVANPADLLGPRTMTPANAERRDTAFTRKWIEGEGRTKMQDVAVSASNK